MIHLRPCRDLRAWASLLVAALSCAHAPSLFADELPGPVVDPRAKTLSDEGRAAFDAGRYDEAIEKFQAAYELSPAPGLLYNLAQAYRLRGDCTAALSRYRAFLGMGVGDRMRKLAEDRVSELAACDAPPPETRESRAAPVLLPRPIAPIPWPRASESNGGPHTLVLVPAKGAEREASRSQRRLLYATVGYGSSVVLLSVGAYFGVRARSAADRVSNTFDEGGAWSPDLAAVERSGKRHQTAALATLTGGLVALGATTCLLAFDW
jgi:hypothetical protein